MITPGNTILLVEEDLDERDRLQRVLTPLANTVLLARDGRDAQSILFRSDPDLIVFNDSSYVNESISLLTIISNTPEFRYKSIIFITDRASDHLKEIRKLDGHVRVEERPVDYNSIAKVAAVLLRRQDPWNESASVFDLYLDPGDATPEDIAELYLALSALHRAHGGMGLEIVEGEVDAREVVDR